MHCLRRSQDISIELTVLTVESNKKLQLTIDKIRQAGDFVPKVVHSHSN